MATTAALTENSRQGINFQIPPCIGSEARLSPNLRLGCCHAYDEMPVGLVVYVRNDPVNKVDPTGQDWECIDRDEEGNCTRVGWVDDRPFDPGIPGKRTVAEADDRKVPKWRLQWNQLSEKCKNGLTTAMGGKGEGATKSRVDALNRALAAKNMLLGVTSGSVIDWKMLAAIGIRETGFQDVVGQPYQDKNGTWHENFGRGVFQIDIAAHPEISESLAMNVTWAAVFAMNYLRDNYVNLANRSLGFDSTHFAQALAASYNLGPGGISGNPDTIDKGSTNNNYGSNVLDLMDCFK